MFEGNGRFNKLFNDLLVLVDCLFSLPEESKGIDGSLDKEFVLSEFVGFVGVVGEPFVWLDLKAFGDERCVHYCTRDIYNYI